VTRAPATSSHHGANPSRTRRPATNSAAAAMKIVNPLRTTSSRSSSGSTLDLNSARGQASGAPSGPWIRMPSSVLPGVAPRRTVAAASSTAHAMKNSAPGRNDVCATSPSVAATANSEYATSRHSTSNVAASARRVACGGVIGVAAIFSAAGITAAGLAATAFICGRDGTR
jgi:hypothetical protein